MFSPDLLRSPISEQFPAGEGLRYEGTYDRIQDARREDDASLAQGIWQTSLKRADWDAVERIASEALIERTRDLQIAAWLLEALIERQGFAGVCAGLEALCVLVETFWADLFPKIEDGDLDYRLSPIEWINEKLPQRLKGIRITRPSGDESVAHSWADLDAAQRLQNLARKDPKAARDIEQQEHQVTIVKFDASLMLTSDAYLSDLLRDIEASIAMLDRFRDSLSNACADQAPSLARFREVLEGVRNLMESTLKARGVATGHAAHDTRPTPTGQAAEQSVLASGARAMPAVPAIEGGAFEIKSRNDAYTMLASIAEYLMRIEPHSPTPYLLKRAVAWGSMPLPMLLLELMQEGSDLANIHTLLGIRST